MKRLRRIITVQTPLTTAKNCVSPDALNVQWVKTTKSEPNFAISKASDQNNMMLRT
jgi:hypothetical protein